MKTTFEEYCKSATDVVEQEISNWHGGKDITLRQAIILFGHNYPLGAFKIRGSGIMPIVMDSLFSNRISFLNGEYELQRDERKLSVFFSSYENSFNECGSLQEKEKIMKKIHDDLLNYCMNIIEETCEFGG